MKKTFCIAVASVMMLPAHAVSRSILFTEVCVANIDQTIDHSNNYGSWVELHNPTDDTVSIEGWYVSDDAGDLKKHRLQGDGCCPFGV